MTMSPAQRHWRDREQWTTIADVFAILTVLSLPWSTSLVAIFVLCWLGAVVWVMDWGAFARLLKQPICYLPLAIVGLAVIGTFWSDAVWKARIYAINPTLKLLLLPALFYHFERSSRGMWVFVAFLGSCTVLMAVSWIVAFDPSLTLKRPGEPGGRGIFVKNYIAQSQEFTLCALALAFPIFSLLRTQRVWQALLLGAMSLGFIVNMAFVIISRTAMVTMPIMLAVFAVLHLKLRTSLMIFGVLAVMAGFAWAYSPQLQRTADTFLTDYQLYKTENTATSIGMRLEFWRKSLQFFVEAPLIGHGTGSILGLFEKAATGDAQSATG
ncbi:MAG: O-antigen ligase family protein, partial [Bradyrhizobium sp.]|nr:O-antigen ligase family protein [Bradyrhizobium sp.]